MKLPTFRAVIGSFRILRQRSRDVGQPGLGVYADAGEQAAEQIGRTVSTKAHADEVADLEAASAIDAGLAGLKDGRVDPEDVAHLERAGRLVRRSAGLAKEIGEVVS